MKRPREPSIEQVLCVIDASTDCIALSGILTNEDLTETYESSPDIAGDILDRLKSVRGNRPDMILSLSWDDLRYFLVANLKRCLAMLEPE